MDIKIIDLKQRHVEAFVKGMPKDSGELPLAAYYGAAIRSACNAGWFLEPVFKAEEVDEMKPADVRALFDAAMKVYSEAMGVPPS